MPLAPSCLLSTHITCGTILPGAGEESPVFCMLQQQHVSPQSGIFAGEVRGALMDANCVSTLWHRASKPQGKVKRRVQDLRIPSSSYFDFLASRPQQDLSHNESVRLATDSLLSRGLEGYHEVLSADGEVDFLSELEKIYILENRRDGSTADPDAADDDDYRDLESLSAGCLSDTRCPVLSSDSDTTVAGSHFRDVADDALDEPNIEVYFQVDSRAAGMKDLVREFIRKATMALAIVMDSFSDVELLCDLLEASRRRNVSVHVLLDHLNLNQFVSMWQDLKLDSRNFPKLSVHSVAGQTYCAKTGRKLTGQIRESFIIADWAKVLTGSYSFSWLSWQVHRSLAVLMRGSAVVPFHREFLGLHSSSKPVPGFVTYITVPRTLPPQSTMRNDQNHTADVMKSDSSHTKTKFHGNEDAQNGKIDANVPVLSGPLSSDLGCSKGNIQPACTVDTDVNIQEKLQPVAQQTVSAANPLHSIYTRHDGQTNVELLGRNQYQVQNRSNPLSPTQRVEEYNTSASHARRQPWTVPQQPPLKTNLNVEHPKVATDAVFFQQRTRDRPMKPLETAAALNKQRRQWHCSLNVTTKVDYRPDQPHVLTSSQLQQQAKLGPLFPCSQPGGRTPGTQTRRQDQLQTLHQQPTAEAQGSVSTRALIPQLQLEPRPFPPGPGAKLLQPRSSQQPNPPPRLTWKPQGHAARAGPVARQTSFRSSYGAAQQPGWRLCPGGANTPLSRSKSMTDRHSAGYRGAGLHPNVKKS